MYTCERKYVCMNTKAHSTKNSTQGKPGTSEKRTIGAVRRGFGLERFDSTIKLLYFRILCIFLLCNSLQTPLNTATRFVQDIIRLINHHNTVPCCCSNLQKLKHYIQKMNILDFRNSSAESNRSKEQHFWQCVRKQLGLRWTFCPT